MESKKEKKKKKMVVKNLRAGQEERLRPTREWA